MSCTFTPKGLGGGAGCVPATHVGKAPGSLLPVPVPALICPGQCVNQSKQKWLLHLKVPDNPSSFSVLGGSVLGCR